MFSPNSRFADSNRLIVLHFIAVLLFCFFYNSSNAQNTYTDSLRNEISAPRSDTDKLNALRLLASLYTYSRQDTSIYYYMQSIQLADKMNYDYGIVLGYLNLAFVLNTASNYSKGLEFALKALPLAEKLKENREWSLAECYTWMGLLNRRMGLDSVSQEKSHIALYYYNKGKIPVEKRNWAPYFNLGLVHLKWKNLDSALYYEQKGFDLSLLSPPRNQYLVSVAASTLADVYLARGNIPLARKYYLIALEHDRRFDARLLRVRLYNGYSKFFRKIGETDSAIYYASQALQMCKNFTFGEHASDAASILEGIYEEQHNADSSLKYLKVSLAIRDSIFSQSKLTQFQLLSFDETQRQKDIQAAKERYQNQVRFYSLIAAAAIFLLLSLLLYRNNRNKQKANRILEMQKKEIDLQRAKAESTLVDLKSTQAQLIQSEKMASLGELTAGIAHEIQNPLNFVNNFSEVNTELISEMKNAQASGNLDEAREIAETIQENERKINHHGKRAETIVKNMLQHSRAGSGKKEATDINALADEYLRLSYHGIRAKEKSIAEGQVAFNATLNTNYDSALETIMVIPQDLGRVLLNLFTNSFYSVYQKQNKSRDSGYEPTVSVSTKKPGNSGKIEIRVRDNGIGISEKLVGKIFQPFFSTKPTGEGTGLGLSLSYDIVKAHGGELRVDSKEGEYAEFIIELPVL